MLGYNVERTGKGHDFKASKTNWLTGKKESVYVEVKTGNSKLSPLQKKKRRQFGDRYVEERTGAGPFGMGSSTIRGTPKRQTKRGFGSSIMGGSGTTRTPKKRRRKRYSGSFSIF